MDTGLIVGLVVGSLSLVVVSFVCGAMFALRCVGITNIIIQKEK